MSEAATELAHIEPRKAITVTVAERYGMEADAFEVALRNTVFLEGNRAEYAAFLVVCNEYKLNPLTKEIYAFKNKQGKIVPVVSIDGWVSLCNGHHAFDGMTFEDLHDEEGKLVSIKCTIFRKDRSRPTEVTEYLSECVRNTEPWKMQHRMLRHKSLIQCARYAFGFSGIYDQEEAEAIGVEVVSSAPAVSITSGFGGEKPVRAPRKAKDAPAPNPTPEPEEPSHASSEAAGDGEFEEGEFVDACAHKNLELIADGDGAQVCKDCGQVIEAPEDARPTGTASAPPADAGQDTSASAAPASDASPGPTGSSPAAEDPEAEEEKTTAEPGEVYLMAGDAFNAEGKRMTYKDGVRFSSVGEKAAAKLTIHDFHAPVIEEASQDEAPAADEGFPGDRVEGAAQESDEFAVAFEKIRAAPGYLAAKQAMKTLSGTEVYALATLEQKAGVRLAVWKRYVELCEDKLENGEVWTDFSLMRMFLDYGATSEKQIDEMWARFDRHAAFKNATEGDQAAMSKLMLARKAALKEAG